MDNEYYMINPLYMQYITDDKKEICHNNLLADIYYFYNGIKPTEKQKLICIDGCMFNVSKHNLKIMDIIP